MFDVFSWADFRRWTLNNLYAAKLSGAKNVGSERTEERRPEVVLGNIFSFV